jgi:ABC-type transport system involved in cytochrome bd biosynthesis fused ATPase/permease subunit
VIIAAEAAGIFLYDEFKQQQLKAAKELKKTVKKPTKKVVKKRTEVQTTSDGEESGTKTDEEPAIIEEIAQVIIEEDVTDMPSQRIEENVPVLQESKPVEEEEPQPNETVVAQPLTEEEKAEKRKILKDKKRRRQLRILNGRTLARGSNLSGGFAQSVALARIFLKKDSRIIILDESMSAMDPIKKRQVIFPNLLKFAKKKEITLVMITHDMTNLDLFDHMLMLENGRIVCQGTHNELMDSRNFKYLQMLGVNMSSL